MLSSTNPMMRALRSLLAFEAVVFGLAIPGMIQISELSAGWAFAIGGTAIALALAAAGLLPRTVGWLSAWLTQATGVALGFATSMMFWVGGMFALLWLITVALGRRLEARASGPR